MIPVEKIFDLQNQLQPYKRILGQAAEVIMDENVSKYPIFVVHQQELEMGIPLIEAGQKFKWSVNASTLEEFVTKDIIYQEKAQEFIQTFKDPETHICLFVLSEMGAQFMFMER
jgi:hypothetical protein